MAAPTTDTTILMAFVFDFETGGLKCQKSACTQIAMHAIRLDTFEKVDSYVSYIYPYKHKANDGTGKQRKVLKKKYEEEDEPLMDYEDKALEYSAITMDMLYGQGKPIEQVAQELLEFISKNTPKCSKSSLPFLIGQNPLFDEGFFCQLMEYGGLIKEIKKVLRGHEDYYGNWHPAVLDTIILGQLALCNRPNINSYKLEIMCENLGIELIDAHDADADVAATASVAAVLTQRMRNIAGEDAENMLSSMQPEKTRKHFKI